MTFRPSDDLLEEINSNGQTSILDQNQDKSLDNLGDDNGQQIFNGSAIFGEENGGSQVLDTGDNVDSNDNEIKAPDLSELLEKNLEKIVLDENVDVVNGQEGLVENLDGVKGGDMSDAGISESSMGTDSTENKATAQTSKEGLIGENHEQTLENDIGVVSGVSDSNRFEIISKVDGSSHSKLDLLVDDRRYSVVEKYGKIHRVVFRWGIFILFSIFGGVLGIVAQVYGKGGGTSYIVDDSSIQNKSDWIEETSDVMFSGLKDDNLNIDVLVPYGFAQVDDSAFQSKSNLISYEGIILPQISHIDLYGYDFISLEKFTNKETTREDLEKMIEYLITSDFIYSKTATLPKISDTRWKGQTFDGSLVDGFNLSCVVESKISNVVCDKFLNIFYKYGKFYDLSRYSSELYVLVKELKEENKDIEPICKLVNEYVLHSGQTSSIFDSIMSNCNSDLRSFYKNLVDFINVENSLTTEPTRVFENSDLNAYKLLSLQQIVYRNLDTSSSVNEDLIKSYLNFVQNLINKDKGSGRYISPFYKDMLYVFNIDELNQKLVQKGKLSSELRMQMDQINYGNPLMDYASLISQLTTPDILNLSGEFLSSEITEKTLDEIFSQLYSMTDHLKIRRNAQLSDTDVQVQAEIYSDEILRVSGGTTLKATIVLHRKDNNLYISSINISNQPDLSNMLNVYVSDGDINLYTAIGYIDEKIGFWYRDPGGESVSKTTLCEELQNRMNVDFYTCDDKSIVLYKGDIEYVFSLLNGVLESFSISDSSLESAVKERFGSILTSRDNTPTLVESIIAFKIEESEENNIEKKLEVVDQFRIHLKIIPTVSEIDGEDNIFIVDFFLGDFELQANYDLNTHLLTNISYVACGKTLEIRDLKIELSTSNESQLKQMLNNPKMFLSSANEAAYRKYQRMCLE